MYVCCYASNFVYGNTCKGKGVQIYLWDVFHVLLGGTFVFGLCTKKHKNLNTKEYNLVAIRTYQFLAYFRQIADLNV